MNKKQYVEYIKRKFLISFPDFIVVNEQYESMMGFLITFEKKHLQVSFVLERGNTVEGEVAFESKVKKIKNIPYNGISNKGKFYIQFHQISNTLKDKSLTCENIDLIINTLEKHKNEIFKE